MIFLNALPVKSTYTPGKALVAVSYWKAFLFSDRSNNVHIHVLMN